MHKKISYKCINIPNMNELAINKYSFALGKDCIYFIENKKVFKYILYTDEIVNLELQGEKIFVLENMFVVLNANILTIFDRKNQIENFTVKNGYFKIKQTKNAIAFLYENLVDTILCENNKITRTLLTCYNIKDIAIYGDFVYFLTNSELFKLKNIILNRCNDHKKIGDSDIVKINNYLSIKKHKLRHLTGGEQIFVDNLYFDIKDESISTNSYVLVEYSHKIIKYTEVNGILREQFVFKKYDSLSNNILICVGRYAAFSDILVEIGGGLFKVLSDKVLCIRNNMFLSPGKLYLIEEATKELSVEFLEKCSSFLVEDEMFNIDANKIEVPTFLTEEEKEMFINFKVKAEKWKRILKRIKENRSDVLKQDLKLKGKEIEKDLAELNEKKEIIKDRVENLVEKAKTLHKNIKINDLLQKLQEKLGKIENKNLKQYKSRLLVQNETLKDILSRENESY